MINEVQVVSIVLPRCVRKKYITHSKSWGKGDKEIYLIGCEIPYSYLYQKILTNSYWYQVLVLPMLIHAYWILLMLISFINTDANTDTDSRSVLVMVQQLDIGSFYHGWWWRNRLLCCKSCYYCCCGFYFLAVSIGFKYDVVNKSLSDITWGYHWVCCCCFCCCC